METSASFEARYAPLPYPTNQVSGNLCAEQPTDVVFSRSGTHHKPLNLSWLADWKLKNELTY